jgi:signal transduction histidine kinase
MSLRPQQLYLKLYLWFLVILTLVGIASVALVGVMNQGRLRPMSPTHGTRLLYHLTRTLSGITDDKALADALVAVHDDLDLDAVVLSPQLEARASAGTPFPLPGRDVLEGARRVPAWPQTGIVAGPLDGGVLILRFSGVAAQRGRLRRLLLTLFGLAIAGLLLYPLSRNITRPLDQLTHAAQRFGSGDLTARSGVDRQDEVGKLARTFDEMAARIEAARRAERELLANVSHELRTPLARLQVALELLDARDEASQRRVQSIREEVEDLDRLIGDVLTASRLELASLPLHRRELSLPQMAAKARERALSLDPRRTVQVDVPAGLQLEADEALIARVLDNLIDNARKYDPSGKPIRVEARREGGEVVLAVQDEGPGIPVDELEKVFEPFFRGGNARSETEGFGLGLALARRVAEAHGGTIRALNPPGGGARLEVRLPVAA